MIFNLDRVYIWKISSQATYFTLCIGSLIIIDSTCVKHNTAVFWAIKPLICSNQLQAGYNVDLMYDLP